MLSKSIREAFLKYFESKDHSVVASSPVVPHEDPTLLFTNAGMNQFKDVFLGKSSRDYKRAVSSQKCVRVGGKHNDLDNVGHTSRHMTFFEMLGNFSFGDYFKEKAIQYAWEVCIEVFKLDKDKLWITIYEDDDEALQIWKAYVSEDRIIKMGKATNFWSMGDVGPCGPCSELYYDRGEAFGSAKNPKEDEKHGGERFIEFWNLVFMQYSRSKDGKLSNLPKPCVDTGAGLERIVSLKLGVDSVFQTDILGKLIEEIEKISKVSYDPKNEEIAPAFHVIADHVRTLSFAISDGAQPSNVDRGYVLRKILRRAVRYGRMLGLEKPFLGKLVPLLCKLIGDAFPEICQNESRIIEILHVEEESFQKTLKRGGNILQMVMERAKSDKNHQISGEEAFKLKDTYGFPIEEILLIAKDNHLEVNLDAYQLLEEQAKKRSRAATSSVSQEVEQSIYSEFAKTHGTCKFIGYDHLKHSGSIIGIFYNGQSVDKLETGQSGIIILDQTPFYAEKGGQVSDKGYIQHETALFDVAHVSNPFSDIIVHEGEVKKGSFIVGEPIEAVVDEHRRNALAIYHSATHLLHWALCKILGKHVRQGGSLVETNRLRFDFSHHKALTNEQIREVEHLVNEKIRENAEVHAYETPYKEVQNDHDIKQFFGEKYGSNVRVVDIGGYSKELCGGTHLHHLAPIGMFRITKESSVAAGIRRIEAACSSEALAYTFDKEKLLETICDTLGSPESKVLNKLHHNLDEIKLLKEQISEIEKEHLKNLSRSLIAKVEKINAIPTLMARVDLQPKQLAIFGNELFAQMHQGILFLALEHAGKCQLLIKVSDDIIAKGIHANELIKQIAPLVKGGGGGKKDAAQAGGSDPSKLDEAFEKFKQLIGQAC